VVSVSPVLSRVAQLLGHSEQRLFWVLSIARGNLDEFAPRRLSSRDRRLAPWAVGRPFPRTDRASLTLAGGESLAAASLLPVITVLASEILNIAQGVAQHLCTYHFVSQA
jgi:hypothetical protein